jgi:two-component system CheB/CheR fusion protein
MSQAREHAGFERILEYLRQTRGFDFTAYKPTSLSRRVRTRVESLELAEFDDYLDYLRAHPDEFSALFNTILINVTSFFRDAEMWASLRTNVLPELAKDVAPIRVWSAGCASGQEAYSAAILLAEALGLDEFRDRVTIYATDVDEEALAESRRAVYTPEQLSDVPPELVTKYFDRNGGELYTCNRDLRRAVVFGRHDLIQDAPISRVDLLICRNTLMYFTSEAQARIMAGFYSSVNPGGHLVLGPAEMLFGHAAMFEPVDLTRRIFRAISRVNDSVPQYEEPQSTLEALRSTDEELNSSHAFLEAVFTSLRSAVVVLDRDLRIQVWNAGALDLWGVRAEEAQGNSLFNLDIGLPVGELHQPIRDIVALAVAYRELSLPATNRRGRAIQCRVSVAPLIDSDNSVTGVILLMEEEAAALIS